MSAQSNFPYPIPEYGSEPYWAACNELRLVMQRCATCEKFRWQPAPLCTFCAGEEFAWTPLSGRGKITTWTVVTHPVHPAAVERVPYVVVEVELEELAGLRMLSNLLEIDLGSIAIGALVTVDFIEHAAGQMLPVFRLTTSQEEI